MNNRSEYISAGTEKLHYLAWGTGKRLLLAFPGFGDVAEKYSPFEAYLGDEYTILSFDLPHHGESKWGDQSVLSKNDLAGMVRVLMAQYGVQKVSLLGYSMGGRVCLTIVECLPACIDKITLLAADGFVVNPYYYFFTRTFIGKKIFRNMLQKPRPWFRIMDWLKKYGLADAARYKFAMHFLHLETSRKFLLHVWQATSPLIPNIGTLKSEIRQYHIPISIFMGVNDKIMPPVLAKKFKTGLETVQLHLLDKGHRILDNETVQPIASTLL